MCGVVAYMILIGISVKSDSSCPQILFSLLSYTFCRCLNFQKGFDDGGNSGIDHDVSGGECYHEHLEVAWTIPDGSIVVEHHETVHADFGPEVISLLNGSRVAITTPVDGCGDLTHSLKGSIAVIERGDCWFCEKAIVAEKAGAIGVILVNNQPGTINFTLTIPEEARRVCGDFEHTIPIVMIEQEPGERLTKAIGKNKSLTVDVDCGKEDDNDICSAIECTADHECKCPATAERKAYLDGNGDTCFRCKRTADGSGSYTCWDADTNEFGTCQNYAAAGYTCVGTFCAAMEPSGHPHLCAKPRPPGWTVNAATGECEAPADDDEDDSGDDETASTATTTLSTTAATVVQETACKPGFGFNITSCQTCAPGYWSNTNDLAPCKEQKWCNRKQYMNRKGTSTRNVVCTWCADGSYQNAKKHRETHCIATASSAPTPTSSTDSSSTPTATTSPTTSTPTMSTVTSTPSTATSTATITPRAQPTLPATPCSVVDACLSIDGTDDGCVCPSGEQPEYVQEQYAPTKCLQCRSGAAGVGTTEDPSNPGGTPDADPFNNMDGANDDSIVVDDDAIIGTGTGMGMSNGGTTAPGDGADKVNVGSNDDVDDGANVDIVADDGTGSGDIPANAPAAGNGALNPAASEDEREGGAEDDDDDVTDGISGGVIAALVIVACIVIGSALVGVFKWGQRFGDGQQPQPQPAASVNNPIFSVSRCSSGGGGVQSRGAQGYDGGYLQVAGDLRVQSIQQPYSTSQLQDHGVGDGQQQHYAEIDDGGHAMQQPYSALEEHVATVGRNVIGGSGQEQDSAEIGAALSGGVRVRAIADVDGYVPPSSLQTELYDTGAVPGAGGGGAGGAGGGGGSAGNLQTTKQSGKVQGSVYLGFEHEAEEV